MCNNAKKLLGLIYCGFHQYVDSSALLQIYVSLIRPYLEYGTQVWNPHKVGDVKLIKGVQKFALRMCTKNWKESYETLLNMCQLQSHEVRRIYIDMSTMFKIMHNMMCFPSDIFKPYHANHRITRSTSTSCSSASFSTLFCSYQSILLFICS